MPNTYSSTIDPARWEIDASGFLRIRTRVLCAGIMSYARSEIGEENIPPDIKDDPILLCVMPDTLAEPHGIRSLEGMPITIMHADISVQDTEDQVGCVAGAPSVEGPYLCADMRLTDAQAIAQVVSRELVELSSAYRMEVLWGRGEYDGAPFHGKQTKLRYDHVALLPSGHGRAGPDVRVLNQQPKGDKSMPAEATRTMVKIGNRSFAVANEDAKEIANAVDEVAEETKKTTSTAFNDQLEEIAAQLKEATDAKAAADAKVAELQGQLQEMRDQLDKAGAPEVIEEKAEAMNAEREEAAAIMNSKTLAPEFKKLSGHKLRVAVINSVRATAKQTALTEAELKDEAAVRGRYAAMVENAKLSSGKQTVVTGANVSVKNSTDAPVAQPQTYAAERFAKLYPNAAKK